jgi:chromosome segregation ATPase
LNDTEGLKEQLVSYEKQVNELQQVQDQLVDGHRKKDAQILDITQQLEQSTSHTIKLEEVLGERKTEIDSALVEIAELSVQADEYKKQVEASREELRIAREIELKLRHQLKEVNEDLSETEKGLNQLNVDYEQVVNESSDLKGEKDKLIQCIHSLEGAIDALENEKKDSMRLIEQYEHEIDIGGKELALSQKKLYELEKSIVDSQNALDEKSRMVAEADSRCLKIEGEYKEVVNRNKQLEEELSTVSASLSASNKAVDEMDGQLKELVLRNEQSTSCVEKLTERESELRSEVTRLRDAKNQLQGENTSLISVNEELQSRVNHLQSVERDLVSGHAHKDAQISDISSQLERERGESARLRDEISRLTALVDDCRSKCNELSVEAKDNRKTLALNSKLLVKSNVDLESMRSKYVEKSESEKLLKGLIVELQQKLEIASQYFIQLESEHPELLDAPFKIEMLENSNG